MIIGNIHIILDDSFFEKTKDKRQKTKDKRQIHKKQKNNLKNGGEKYSM